MFAGYLLRGGGVDFPHEYILYESYETVPSQRQDLDAYQDSLGNLHRNVVPHDRTKISFKTLDLNLAGKQAIQSFFAGATINARERKCTITYWNDESNTYVTSDFYIPDITFTIKEISSNDISYKGIEIHLIEY